MSVLVVGADGAVAAGLCRRLDAAGTPYVATTRRKNEAGDEAGAGKRVHLDLADVDGAPTLPPAEVAFLCAAVTGYAVCRENPGRTWRVNVEGTVALARRLRERGCRVVYLSTAAVFDGRAPHRAATEGTCPNTEYGRSKAAAEAALLAMGGGVAVVRLTKVIPPDFPLFGGWIEALGRGEGITPFVDMGLAPVAVDRVADALVLIAQSGEDGLFQISAERDITYLDAALRIADSLGAPRSLVHPVRAGERGVPEAERPLYTSLDGSRLEDVTGWRQPDPLAAVDGVVAARSRHSPAPQETS